MRCPTLAELPPPPPGRTGWPWTEECPQLPDAMPDGRPWPRISIVTPSFNQGAFIEETIRSILLQGYPDLEYIVMDGGSTDGAVDVIRRYAPWLAHWRSEPDRGQADAINKGLKLCSGKIFQFINSDDIVARGALCTIGSVFDDADAVAGGVKHFTPQQVIDYRNAELTPLKLLRREAVLRQPGVWLNFERMQTLAPFDTSLQYVFDKDYLVRFFYYYPSVRYTKHCLVYFRLHEHSKTVKESLRFKSEYPRIAMSLAETARDQETLAESYKFLISHWQEKYAAATLYQCDSYILKIRWLVTNMLGPLGLYAVRLAYLGAKRRARKI